MKRYLSFVIIALVALFAVSGGTVLYRIKRGEFHRNIDISSNDPSVKPGATPPHIRGEAGARVVLEEFGDFQCPPCADLWLALSKIEQDYGAKLKVVFRQYPLAMHKYGELAARAAEAAGKQDRFWEMHDLLYRNQAIWSSSTAVEGIFNKYAFSIGLDVERYKADLTSEEVKVRILADQQRANSLGVRTTPSLFLNGQPLAFSSANEPGLRAAIDEALQAKSPASAISPAPIP